MYRQCENYRGFSALLTKALDSFLSPLNLLVLCCSLCYGCLLLCSSCRGSLHGTTYTQTPKKHCSIKSSCSCLSLTHFSNKYNKTDTKHFLSIFDQSGKNLKGLVTHTEKAINQMTTMQSLQAEQLDV